MTHGDDPLPRAVMRLELLSIAAYLSYQPGMGVFAAVFELPGLLGPVLAAVIMTKQFTKYLVTGGLLVVSLVVIATTRRMFVSERVALPAN